MQGIVTLLDQQMYTEMEEVWDELARQSLWDKRGPQFPHVSCQVADAYDIPQLEAALHTFARGQDAFRVHASGVGIFTGAEPVLFYPVVRTAELSAFHAALWEAIAPTAHDLSNYYAPDQWIPHITIAQHGLDADMLGKFVTVMAPRIISWDITVDNLAYIEDHGDTSEVRLRVPLG